MKTLLTGATGFLGKKVLSLLLETPSIEKVFVASRKKASHPDPRVTILPIDLADPSFTMEPLPEVDHIIHLAGLYDFTENYESNYRNNVLSAINLAQWIKNSQKRVPLVFASTYAVRFNSTLEENPPEQPLKKIPERIYPYPHTKALAERIFTDNEAPSIALRFGVLVGDSEKGAIERINGPYYLMRLLHRFNQTSLKKVISPSVVGFPIPTSETAILPLVPIDIAAKVTVEALNQFAPDQKGPKVFEVYHPKSVSVRHFCMETFPRLVPGLKPYFIHEMPEWVLSQQDRLTHIPKEIFDFSLRPVELNNPRFQEAFSSCLVPPFEEYRENFYRGFNEFIFGTPHERPHERPKEGAQ